MSDAIARTAEYRDKNKYQTSEEQYLGRTLSGAKKRCYNNHKNYGGRGIQFNFTSVREAVAYVYSELPAREEGETLDRIDNDGHYEKGNLRWASRTTQRLNQRPHFRGNENSKRISRLHATLPEFSRESIRRMVTDKGYTDDQILKRKKGAHR